MVFVDSTIGVWKLRVWRALFAQEEFSMLSTVDGSKRDGRMSTDTRGACAAATAVFTW